MNKTKGFDLVGIIIIIVITSIVASIATGVIMLNNTSNMKKIEDDSELQDFIEVYDTLLSKYYDDIDKKAILEAAEEGMLNYLGDKYTTFLNDSEYQEILDELSSTYKGIGVSINGNVINSVTESSPAEKAGLLKGDVITKINGINVLNKNAETIKKLIKDDKSNYVELEVDRYGENLSFNIEKEKLVNQTVSHNIIDNTNIGYIYISKFSENLNDLMKDALKDLEENQITSLIIDLRDNVGGYLSSAEMVSKLFLEKGKKIYSLKTSTSEYTYEDDTKEKRDYPIIVLINENSASAAEILAAALKDSYGATLVGTQSFGKGKVQQVTKLENGEALKSTTANWLTPSGICIDGIGISPDYYVENSEYSSDDFQLNKAIELLN